MDNTAVKYAIVTHDSYIGFIWESNGKEVIVLDKTVEIDLNEGFQIKDFRTGAIVSENLWLDVITSSLLTQGSE